MIRGTILNEDDRAAVVTHELFQKNLIGSTIKSALTLFIDEVTLVDFNHTKYLETFTFP